MTRDVVLAVACCSLVVLAALALLIRERRIATRLRRQMARLDEDIRRRDDEARHLAAVLLPRLVDGTAGDAPGGAALVHESLAETSFGRSVRSIADLVRSSVEAVRGRAEASARNTLKSSVRALQALANEQQFAISQMQERHDDPDVLQDLLVIDHTNSQFARRAQVIAVLCGSWPGRQRAASPLIDVVRGATSRIRDYRRVQVHSQVDLAVTSRAVEPVVLAIAELLDNAARHSQPNSAVQVSMQPGQTGASVVIDDAGVGLVEHEIRRAESLLSGQHASVLKELGDPPQFGFAVVGVLAARYGFRVSVDTRSPYGGVRAVVFVPNELLTPVHDDPAPGPAHTASVAAGTSVDGDQARSHAQSSLPQRRRRQPLPHARRTPDSEDRRTEGGPAGAPNPPRDGLPPQRHRRHPLPNAIESTGPDSTPGDRQAVPDGAEPGRGPSEAAAVIGAFARGTRAGRKSADTSTEGDSPR